MSLIKQAGLSLGDWIATRKIQAFNRTGATVQYGEAAMIDILGTQSETTSIVPGNEASVFCNVGPVTQALIEESAIIVVCADPAGVADNALGNWYLCGVIDVMVSDDDVSTTDIDRGDGITILVSQAASANGTDTAGSSLTVGGAAFQQWVTAGTGTRRLGIALEDARASGTGVGVTKKAIFWGGIPGMGLSDT